MLTVLLAALENAEAALVTASGMATISTTLMSLLTAGDHLLIQDCLYGGTHDLVTKEFGTLGPSFDFIDAEDPHSWKRLLRTNTRAIYVETIANPLLQVPDVRAVVDFARSNGLVSLIDNTFASPVNFRPVEWAFDVSLHCCTKYLNGHSNIVAGAVIGRAKIVERVKHKLDLLGGSLDPHAAFLLHRGMKTLAVRVKCQNQSALEIARFLEAHAGVARVRYPGLESHPHHQRARELFRRFWRHCELRTERRCGGSGTVHAVRRCRLTLRVWVASKPWSLVRPPPPIQGSPQTNGANWESPTT